MKYCSFIPLVLLLPFLFVSCSRNYNHTHSPTTPANNNSLVFGQQVNGVQIGLSQHPLITQSSIIIQSAVRSESSLLINPTSLSNHIRVCNANDALIRPERIALIDPIADNPDDYMRISGDSLTTITIAYDADFLYYNLLKYKIPNDRIIKLQCVLIGGYFGDSLSLNNIWYGNAYSPVIKAELPLITQ